MDYNEYKDYKYVKIIVIDVLGHTNVIKKTILNCDNFEEEVLKIMNEKFLPIGGEEWINTNHIVRFWLRFDN